MSHSEDSGPENELGLEARTDHTGSSKRRKESGLDFTALGALGEEGRPQMV